MTREALAGAIAEAALLRGSFTLRSGRTSGFYLDKYLFSTRPELLRELADVFAERIAAVEREVGQPARRLAGAELGGVPLVTAASLRTGKPCVFVRNSKKDYGTAKRVEGRIEPGDTVILLEDVATTGGQAIEAVRTLEAEGAKVLGVIATIDRLEGAAENMAAAGVRFGSIFNTRDLGIRE